MLTRLISAAALLFVAVLSQSPTVSPESRSDSTGATDGRQATREAVARVIAETPDISEVQISPNATYVAYTVSRGSVERNNYTTELFALPLTRDGRSDGAPRLLASETRDDYSHLGYYFVPRWCPNSACLSYFRGGKLIRYDVRSAQATSIEVRDTGAPIRSTITRVVPDYRWSPDATEIAFMTSVASTNLNPRRGMNVSVDWAKPIGRRALIVLNVATGSITQLSPDSLDTMRGFSWAPDGRALVFAAASGEWTPTRRADLFVVDRVTRAVRLLVVEPSGCDFPAWSPDGRWISFRTLDSPPRLSVVPATGGAVTHLTRADGPPVSVLPSSMDVSAAWSPDSRSILFDAKDRLNNLLMRAKVPPSQALVVAPPALALEDTLAYDADFSISETGAVAFTRRMGASPALLYVSPPPERGSFNPQPVTEPDPRVSLQSTAHVQRISWPSADGQFVLEGVLLTPKAAWQGERVTHPLPTLLCMKDDNADAELGNAPTQGMAVARGYAVLIPRQRGRTGYGVAFRREQGRNYIRQPVEDALVALDMLVKRGIADNTKLGVYGLSQGGTRTAGLVTMTNRFRAAVVREAHGADLVGPQFLASASPNWQHAISERQGGGDVYDLNERARIEQQSPIHNMARVKTPTLLLFGAHSYAPTVGRMLFNGLQHFGVPSEFVVYDEGHGIARPAAVEDYLVRTLAWFDYWLLDQPYSDAERQREYDAWKRNAQSTR